MQKQIAKQKGIVLIIFAIILVLSAMAYLIKMFDPALLQAARDDKNAQFLAQAKQALISYSVSRAAAGERPGDMPRPDYFASTEVPFDYDGTADTGCMNATILPSGLPLILSSVNVRCLGRLPWITVGLSIPDSSQSDPSGNMPWYAVSANLVDVGCAKFINPKLVNLPYAGYVCNSDVATSYPWLTVRDASGNILSNQVAAVLMLPGSALPGQSRPVAPLAGASNYLDTVTVPAGCAAPCVPGAYSNADFDNNFIMPPPPNAPSNTSNDRLVYITLQELMTAVERRAIQDAAVQLKRYYTNSSAIAANRFYPYAANLGDINNACANTVKAGFLPVLPASANCTNASTCTTDFPLTKVDFSLSSGLIFTSNSGSCSRSTGSCVCTGAGNCRRGAARFTCTAVGAIFSCQSTGAGSAGTFSFTYTPKTPDVTVISGACTGGAGTVNCVGAAGTFSSPPTTCAHPNPGLATLPAWFTNNNWQEYIYYAISNNCSAVSTGCAAANLTVGAHNNVHAAVVAAGITLASTQALPIPQVRPSASITDYLDSFVNTDGGTAADPTNIIFDATSKMKANDYNDQTLIVAP